MRAALALALAAVALTACSSSHGSGMDAGADASPPPSACGPCDQPCCTRDPVSGATVDPFCPMPMMECEGPPILSCEDMCPPVPAGCFLDSFPPVCDCTAVVCPPTPGSCEGLGEAACWDTDGCVAVYDDDCCPLCRPIGACADCVDWGFFRCAAEDAVCGAAADPCGPVPGCDGGAPDCADAVPNLDLGSCSVAGCVPALESGCLEGCETTCRPVTGGSCTALCEIVEPPCPDGMTAEANGTCYTGFCIPTAVCAVSP